MTGNTITSISAGIYDIDSPFPLILNAVDVVGLKEPIWHKMSAPNIWHGEDYDGNRKKGRFRADIVTDEDFRNKHKHTISSELQASSFLQLGYSSMYWNRIQ